MNINSKQCIANIKEYLENVNENLSHFKTTIKTITQPLQKPLLTTKWLKIATRNIQALIDTGATLSAIHEQFLATLPYEFKAVTKESLTLTTADGHQYTSKISVIVPIILDNYEYIHKYHVVKDLPIPNFIRH